MVKLIITCVIFILAKKAKKPAPKPKSGGPILANDEEIVKPQIMDPNDGIPNGRTIETFNLQISSGFFEVNCF